MVLQPGHSFLAVLRSSACASVGSAGSPPSGGMQPAASASGSARAARRGKVFPGKCMVASFQMGDSGVVVERAFGPPTAYTDGDRALVTFSRPRQNRSGKCDG